MIAAALQACATPPAKDFVKGNLGGKINGREWHYKHAYVDPTIETPEEDDLVFVFLSYKPKNECPTAAEVGKDTRSVMVSAPKAKKLTKLKGGTSRNLVFHSEEKGQQVANVAKAGKFMLTTISDHVVKGQIFGSLNDGNWVSGNFAAVVCDYEALR